MNTASWGRRLLAICVDWFASTLVVLATFGPDELYGTGGGGFLVLGVFALESAVLTALSGGSFGKLVTGLRTVREDGSGHLDLLRSVARAVAVCLLIPPLVFRPDRRGLHDILVDSVTVPVSEVTR